MAAAACLGFVALVWSCKGVPTVAPTGSVVSMFANPLDISAGGTSQLTVSVFEVSGQPVPDGAKVAAMIRRELKDRIDPGAKPEVTTVGGTELAVVLRGEAANASTARWLVERGVAGAMMHVVEGSDEDRDAEA